MKYKNKKCKTIFAHQEYSFDSIAEMKYFLKLGERLKRFQIEKLKLQPCFVLSEPFQIHTNKTKSGKSDVTAVRYTPDFEYFEDGKRIVVEVKGMKTTSYQIRLRLFLSQAYEAHGIDTFIEVQNGKEVVYDCSSVKLR